MSSWIIAKSISQKKAVNVLTQYHDTTMSPTIPDIYLNFLAAYIYNTKMGEPCNVWDPTGILASSLKYNPQVKQLKEKPDISATMLSTYTSLLASMKFKDIQKNATSVIDYSPNFNRSITQLLEKAAIRQPFDIGLHIVSDSSGESMSTYIDIVKAYQLKTKKTTLSIYLMVDSYDTVKVFQQHGLPSWKVTSTSRNMAKDGSESESIVRMMADAQVLSAVPALVLDFKQPVDRFIYVMNSGLVFFKEVKDLAWRLI